jgi:hypothetical protein
MVRYEYFVVEAHYQYHSVRESHGALKWRVLFFIFGCTRETDSEMAETRRLERETDECTTRATGFVGDGTQSKIRRENFAAARREIRIFVPSQAGSKRKCV